MGIENAHLERSYICEAVTNWYFWTVLLIIDSTASNTFVSIVIKGMGFDKFLALVLYFPLGAMSIMTAVRPGHLGRKIPKSRHHIYTAACVLVIFKCCLLWKLPSSNTGGSLVGVYLVTFFGLCYVQVIALGNSNFACYTKKSVYAAGVFMTYRVGYIIGPLLFGTWTEVQSVATQIQCLTFIRKFGLRYGQAFTSVMVCFAVAVVICETTRFMLQCENTRRDREYGLSRESHGLKM
ncbi:hypothetical protein N7495_002377 [Penicillium taxi]|uniref:uncharacterized protein n=1 Tax=Penicillium taxi TaxID=168475 RepID=UPI0025454C28|nr:uncharacterized protein N7495_002377 [Penicillium taxi]KAJ5901849.1 hypothetical protein N7495_002377 [Penicillium taxi]